MVDFAETRFVFIPGAGGMAWYWHRVVELFAGLQREAIAVDLPADDERAGFHEYRSVVVRALEDVEM